MNNYANTQPQKLVIYMRSGLAEQEHYGYVVRSDKTRILEKIGDDKNYPFFLRSCAKPLQASLIIDYELDKIFDLSDEEIAVCCASHAGEDIHIKTVRYLLNKFGISENYLKCPPHQPISKTAQDELLKNNKKPAAIHNNCSGKHAMMLGLCKLKNWDLLTYDNMSHPLQQEIKKKIYELCTINIDYPITKDGCGVPVHSMPLANMISGYLNLFCDKKYEKIKNAFLNNPYLIGGENRTDTKIIEESNKLLVAKVGAGGLCIVINTELEEGFVVKICDSDMKARELTVIDLINNLHWAKIDVSHEIKTLQNDIIGEIKTLV
ncbi:asparaginase [bacterium]|nr:asparaginase [bacterium]